MRWTQNRKTLRRILREGKVSWKATTMWKASTAPEFTTAMRHILALYDTAPADGRVSYVDEFAPPNLLPDEPPTADRFPVVATTLIK
ncbi:hypothetical protein T261_00322 [Streptomyces lydicus]|nr:hypothetical protein T261_00322 [Streptomyces lydicus]